MKFKIKNEKNKIIVSASPILFKIIIPLFLILLFKFLIPPAFAQNEPHPAWDTYGMLINDTKGNTPQTLPHVIGNEDGTSIVVWEDGRGGYLNIYAQKIDNSGKSLWEKDGVPLSISSGNSNFPSIVGDGAKGAIVVWQDYRHGNADIFAQRINPYGELLWGKEGIIVSSAKAGQFAPEIVSDDAGGAIVVWHDYRSGAGEDIYAQRLDKYGNSLWEKDGKVICAAEGTQWYPKIIKDGSGGAIIIWSDGRKSSSDNNIFAQRINASGNTLWQENGIPISTAAQNQERPEIIFLEEEKKAIAVWSDFRSGNSDIYGQKIDLDGNSLWQKDGIAVCDAPFTQKKAKLSSDGSGGAIVAWEDEREEFNNIYAQRIKADGKPAWQNNGRQISPAFAPRKNPDIVMLKTQDWIIFWEDEKSGKPDILARSINLQGTPLWDSNLVIAAAPQAQKSFQAYANSAGEVIFVFEDNRTGNFDIYAQKVVIKKDPLAITSGRELAWGEKGIVICNAAGSVVQQNLDAIVNTKNEIILVFEDGRSGFVNIYAQKIDSDGRLAWGKDGIAVAEVAAHQANPHLVSDNLGGAIIIWEDRRNENFPAIRAQRLNIIGKKVWESSVILSSVKSAQINSLVVSDQAGGALVCWQDNRDPLSLLDIYIQRISSNGKLIFGEKGKIVISANGDQIDVSMISDGIGGAFLTWTDYRQGDRNPDIYAQRINIAGKLLWNEEGVLICGAPDVQQAPQVISDNEGGAIIAWTDRAGGSYDIYVQHLDKNGKNLWLTDGIPLSQVGRTQQNPHFGNKNILVWEDYRFGNWDIFAGAIDLSGKLLWGEEGMPVVQSPQTQYDPSVISWKNESVIVAWEDYRSNFEYEIYMQNISSAGKSLWPENGIKVLTKNGGRNPRLFSSSFGSSFFVFWEDYTGGGKAIYGQKFTE